jgi:hypothetical protein
MPLTAGIDFLLPNNYFIKYFLTGQYAKISVGAQYLARFGFGIVSHQRTLLPISSESSRRETLTRLVDCLTDTNLVNNDNFLFFQ